MQQNAIKPIRNCRGEAKPRPLTATLLAGSQKIQRQSKARARPLSTTSSEQVESWEAIKLKDNYIE